VNSYEREPPRRKRRDRHSPDVQVENILRCLGAAVILNLNTIPAKLQRALFEAASSMQGSQESAPLKDILAQFMHDHEYDAQRQLNN
jgi:hypothetical protein